MHVLLFSILMQFPPSMLCLRAQGEDEVLATVNIRLEVLAYEALLPGTEIKISQANLMNFNLESS
jgi:hypothetical protein